MVARLIPNQKVACSSHVAIIFFIALLIFIVEALLLETHAEQIDQNLYLSHQKIFFFFSLILYFFILRIQLT